MENGNGMEVEMEVTNPEIVNSEIPEYCEDVEMNAEVGPTATATATPTTTTSTVVPSPSGPTGQVEMNSVLGVAVAEGAPAGQAQGQTQGEEGGLEKDFLELLTCEEEGVRYLMQLELEEDELKKKVDDAEGENHALRLRESELRAKIAAQHEACQKLGVPSLKDTIKEIREISRKAREETDSIRNETLTRSTNMLAEQTADTGKLQDRLKEYWHPQSVDNAINTRKVQISQVQSKIDGYLADLDRAYDELAKMVEEQKKFNEFHKAILESTEAAKQDENNQFN